MSGGDIEEDRFTGRDMDGRVEGARVEGRRRV
jgi:hypothetical protein